MPLVAIALVLGSLLPAVFPALGQVTATTPARATPASWGTVAVAIGSSATNEPAAGPGERWVAPHVETPLWSAAGQRAEEVGVAYRWAPLEVIGEAEEGRLPVRDPADG